MNEEMRFKPEIDLSEEYDSFDHIDPALTSSPPSLSPSDFPVVVDTNLNQESPFNGDIMTYMERVALLQAKFILDLWFPSHKIIVNPSEYYSAPGSVGSFTEWNDYFESSDPPQTYASDYSVGDFYSPPSSLHSSFNGSSEVSSVNEPSTIDEYYMMENSVSFADRNEKKQPQPPQMVNDSAIVTRDKALMWQLSYILQSWGVAPNNGEVLTYLSHFIMECDFFRGIKSKKVAVRLINSFYSERRRLFPFSAGVCPRGSWPENVPYKDPSHLTREMRAALMIWVYGNPAHCVNDILKTHDSLKCRHGIVLTKTAELALRKFREIVRVNIVYEE